MKSRAIILSILLLLPLVPGFAQEQDVIEEIPGRNKVTKPTDVNCTFPVFHLIKGDFCWADFFINAGLNIGIALVLGVFFFFGSQIPKN